MPCKPQTARRLLKEEKAKLDGQVIHKSAKAKELSLIKPFKTFLWDSTISFPPPNEFRGFHEINKHYSKLSVYSKKRASLDFWNQWT